SAYLPAESESTLFVFLEPPGTGPAEGLDLRIEEVSAIREDGLAAPMTIVLDRIAGTRGDHARLFAWGAIPAGRYTALGLRAPRAPAPEAAGAAANEAEETRAPLSFSAEPSKAVVLSARLEPTGAPGAGRPEPALKAGVPDLPALGLLGLAADRANGTVFLFDKVGGHVVRAVRTGPNPGGIAVDSQTQRAYAPEEGEDAIAVVDVSGGSVIGRTPLPGGDGPAEVVLTPDGGTLLSANAGSGTVSVIDARAQVETGRIQVGNAPRSLLLNGAGTRAFVFNTLSNSIRVLDVPAGTVAATLAADSGPIRGVFDRA